VLDVHALDRADALGKSKVSGSLNGGSCTSRGPLPDHGRVEALLDRRPDGEGRGEVVALDDEVRAVADADLVDLAEQVVGGVAGEHVREARLDADADEGEPAGRLHSPAFANCSSPSFTPGSS
jgi:hypothetical protein